jgi:DNA processing protein
MIMAHMMRADEPGFRALTMEELLGRRLNSVEEKYSLRVIYVSGPLDIPLKGIRVSVVGTRNPKHRERARKIAAALVRQKITVVSGLARGVDTVAHTTAIEEGGRTIAVLGTPLNVFYPPENKELQLRIMREHLAISQFPIGAPVSRKNFPMRNRTMALVSHATVVVEAGEDSGVVSQGWECLRLGRLLLIHASLADLPWVKRMMEYGAHLFRYADEMLEAILENCPNDDITVLEGLPIDL